MNVSHATQDLYEAIERKDYQSGSYLYKLWRMIIIQNSILILLMIRSFGRGAVPWLPVGRMVLDRNPVDYHSEIEQAAFGTGVLVDGMDFSDDKMLQGRTFSYSDTQRYALVQTIYNYLLMHLKHLFVQINIVVKWICVIRKSLEKIRILTMSHLCWVVIKMQNKKSTITPTNLQCGCYECTNRSS